MFALTVSSLLLFILKATAQGDEKYTVWSSVVFSRTGDRTPSVLGSIPTTLTSLGAQQQHSAGSFFRTRYIDSFGSTNGLDSAPIQGLSANLINVEQLYINALDEQYAIASAQAFMQGLYPPYSLSGNTSSIIRALDQTLLLANNSYEEPPMGGYQYPMIQTADEYDPLFPYLDGSSYCPAFNEYTSSYTDTADFALTMAMSEGIYQTMCPTLLSSVLNIEECSYYNAYAIYDYLNYQNVHNITFAQLMQQPEYIEEKSGTSYFELIKWYADQQTYAFLGNLHAHNNITTDSYPAPTGSISTIPGALLAAKMLGQLQQAIETQGEYYKLNLLFGDFAPLVSFFALAGLTPFNTDFYGMPDYASTAVFELFTYTTPSDGTTFPDVNDLWVRFYFRNGTSDLAPYQSYALFDNGPDQADMLWGDFLASMSEIMMGSIGDWCQQCGATQIFCAYWNTSDSLYPPPTTVPSNDKVTPAIGGVIGAIVALVVAGLIFGALMLFGGVRFHRVPRGHKSELGGFKGGQKMASDRDLVLPKGGAIVGASVETDGPGSPVAGGHERVGSWELKQNEAGNMHNIAAPQPARRPSFEDDDVGDIGAAPWQKPTKPDERV